MKLGSILGLFLGLTLGIASAAVGDDISDNHKTVWAQNVDETAGWYDVNKASLEEGHPEALMCYAASASNLIAWWQKIYCESLITSTTPPDVNDIWKKYVDNNKETNKGGFIQAAFNWWISGVYSPLNQDGSDWASEDDPIWERFYGTYDDFSSIYAEDGTTPALTLSYPYNPEEQYFYDLHGLQQSDLAYLLSEPWVYNSEEPANFDVDFAEIFEDGGGVSLAIQSDGKTALSHSITLWGVTYDEEGQVAGLWLTDSDDFDNEISFAGGAWCCLFVVGRNITDGFSWKFLPRFEQFQQSCAGVGNIPVLCRYGDGRYPCYRYGESGQKLP